MSEKLVTSCKYILLINMFFWSILGIHYLFQPLPEIDYVRTAEIFVRILMLLVAVLFGICLYGVEKLNSFIYVCALLFTLLLAITSITDQIGWLDISSFVLASAAFINLLLIGKVVFRKEVLTE